MNDKKKLITIICLLVVIFLLIIYAIYFAITHHNAEDIMKVDNLDAKYTLSNSQLDSIPQPNVNEEIILDTLPKANNIIENIDMKTIKQLFKTSKKSILVLVKDGCIYCEQYLPILEEVLKEFNMNAYKVNISTLNEEDFDILYDYLDYEGTPTTYIIQNSKVLHTLTGLTDKDTLKSFIDYFYIRNN
ncbi:MAG: thioredoxin family protein [Bacilli bacterium]|nr:thioredoxin family protein [Bacilli bacterium]